MLPFSVPLYSQQGFRPGVGPAFRRVGFDEIVQAAEPARLHRARQPVGNAHENVHLAVGQSAPVEHQAMKWGQIERLQGHVVTGMALPKHLGLLFEGGVEAVEGPVHHFQRGCHRGLPLGGLLPNHQLWYCQLSL